MVKTLPRIANTGISGKIIGLIVPLSHHILTVKNPRSDTVNTTIYSYVYTCALFYLTHNTIFCTKKIYKNVYCTLLCQRHLGINEYFKIKYVSKVEEKVLRKVEKY